MSCHVRNIGKILNYNNNSFVCFPLVVLFGVLLVSCGKAQQVEVWGSSTKMKVPTEEQLAFSVDNVPISLYQMKGKVNKSLSKTVKLSKNSLNRQKIRPAEINVTNDGDNPEFNFRFNPFGANNTINSLDSDSDCAVPQVDGELNRLHDYGLGSFCLVAVAKMAMMRALSNYSSFGHIMPFIASGLADANNPKGAISNYSNSVETYGAKGLKIEVFYDDCSNHRPASLSPDSKALTMCTSKSDTAVYHRVRILVDGENNGSTAGSSIGIMEWLVYLDGSTTGEMIIDRFLMTDLPDVRFAPPQIQFDFESDANANFKSFTMKFEPHPVTQFDSVSRQWRWEANVIKLTRRPAIGNDPALWFAQGNILFSISSGHNPLDSNFFTASDPHLHQEFLRVYFTAVSENTLNEGKAVYKAIMTDETGTELASFTEPQWERELHMWAYYKKLLKRTWTQSHYELRHNADNKPLMNLVSTALPLTAEEQAELQAYYAEHAHEQAILDVAFNSADNKFVTGTGHFQYIPGGTIRVFDEARRIKIQQIDDAHSGKEVNKVSFHPTDDDLILSGGGDNFARIYRVSTGVEVMPLINALNPVWSADGTRIASVSYDGSKIWDAVTGEVLSSFDDSEYRNSIKFDPSNNNFLITGGQGGSRIWDINALSTPTEYNDPDGATVYDVAFSEDGNFFATTTSEHHVHLWDRSNTSAPIRSAITYNQSTPKIGSKLKFSADGKNIFVLVGNSILNFNTATLGSPLPEGLPVETWMAKISASEQRSIESYALRSDDITASIGVDFKLYGSGSTRVWHDINLFSGPSADSFSIDGSVTAHEANYSPDGKFVVSAHSNGDVVIWDAPKGIVLEKINSAHASAALSARYNPNGTKFVTASADGTAKVWDATTAALLSTVSHLGNPPLSAASFLDDATIVTAASDGSVMSWDATSGAELSTFDTQSVSSANDIYFLPTDSTRFVVATSAGTQLWSTGNPTAPLCTLGSSSNNSARISPDGLRVITTTSSNAHLYSIDSSVVETYCIERGFVTDNRLQHAIFSPHDGGKHVITQNSGSGSSDYSEFYLWDMDPDSLDFETKLKVMREPCDCQNQERRPMSNIAYQPDGLKVLTMGASSNFNPAWIAFDDWFTKTDNSGKALRPDEDNDLNPYYVDVSTTNDGCFTSSEFGGCGEGSGYLSCADVGGCEVHNVVSQFEFYKNDTTPGPEYDYLKSQLDLVSPAWIIDSYSSKIID